MWFFDNVARLHFERTEIDKLISEAEWLVDVNWEFIGSQLALSANIVVDGHEYSVQMVYPPYFPINPPSVRPIGTDERWSNHQYGAGGELCLEWGPDNWQDTVTGADMLRSVYKLLEIERPLEPEASQTSNAPSRHFLTLGQQIRGRALRFPISSSTKGYLIKLAEESSGSINIHVMISRESIAAFINKVKISGSEQWENPLIPKELEKTTFQHDGIFYKTGLSDNELTTLETSDLRERLAQEGIDFTRIDDANNRFLLLISRDQGFHLFSVMDEANWHVYRTINLPDVDLLSRIGSDLEIFKKARVGIIGIGSAGSKIATSLARSGIRDFLLFDYDLFLPENICRHELTWEDVGQHKVDGISHFLALIDPEIKVESRKIMLTGQESSSGVSSAMEQLTGCNIIIDATADPNVFNLSSAVAYQSNTPYIWFEIYEGGIGGFLGRFRPGKEPTPTIMRSYLLEYLSKFDSPKLKNNGDYSAITEEGEIIVATDADVTIISGYATNMALDILAENDPSKFPHSMYLIGLHKGWIFEEPFVTQPLDVSMTKSDTPSGNLTPEEKGETLHFLRELLDNQES